MIAFIAYYLLNTIVFSAISYVRCVRYAELSNKHRSGMNSSCPFGCTIRAQDATTVMVAAHLLVRDGSIYASSLEAVLGRVAIASEER